MIPLGRLIQMVNQKRSPAQRLPHPWILPRPSFGCSVPFVAVCITPVELKTVSVDPGAMTRMLDRLACKGWIERLPNPADKRGVLVQLTPDGAALCEQCHQVVGQKLHQELTKNLSADEVAMLEQLLKKGPAVTIRRGKMMSRRNNDAITIHSILSWIEDNLESPLSLEKVSERSGYSSGTCNVCLRKRPAIPSASTSAVS